MTANVRPAIRVAAQHDPVERRMALALVAVDDRGQQALDGQCRRPATAGRAPTSRPASRTRRSASPPSSGPRRFDIPALAPQIPSALPRRSGGKPETAPASAAGLTRPAPAPWMIRATSSWPKLPARAPNSAPTREQHQAAQGQPPGAEAVDKLAAGDEHERVGREVGAEDDRGRAAAHVQPAGDRRQRDGDQGSVELEQCRRGGAGSQPRPRGAGNGSLGLCLCVGGQHDRGFGHSFQYRGRVVAARSPG